MANQPKNIISFTSLITPIVRPLDTFIKSSLAAPTGVRWKHIFGAGLLAGIGFTMSIFVTLLAFDKQPEIEDLAKVSIVLASTLSAILGWLFLRFAVGKTTEK